MEDTSLHGQITGDLILRDNHPGLPRQFSGAIRRHFEYTLTKPFPRGKDLLKDSEDIDLSVSSYILFISLYHFPCALALVPLLYFFVNSLKPLFKPPSVCQPSTRRNPANPASPERTQEKWGFASFLDLLTYRTKAATTDPDVRRTWILFGDPTTKLKN
jgi:hypothetical protein